MGTASRVCTSCDTPLPPEAKFCLNCGAATPTMAGEPPRSTAPTDAPFQRPKEALADRYAVERELGRGGMATVYLAEDLQRWSSCAV